MSGRSLSLLKWRISVTFYSHVFRAQLCALARKWRKVGCAFLQDDRRAFCHEAGILYK